MKKVISAARLPTLEGGPFPGQESQFPLQEESVFREQLKEH
jgi:hypothetical protein